MNDPASGKIRLILFIGFKEWLIRNVRSIVWIGLSITLLFSVLGAVFVGLTGLERGPTGAVSELSYILLGLVLAAVGVPICLQQPRNPVGWVMLFAGFSVSFQSISQSYSIFSWSQVDGRLPGTMLATWFLLLLWVLPYTFFMLVLLLFPTGKLLSRRWRWVCVAALLYTTMLVFLVAFSSPMIVELPGVDRVIPNPIGLWMFPQDRWSFLSQFIWPPLLALILLSTLSIALRWRRASGDERQQIKVVIYAVTVIVVALIVGTFIESVWYDIIVDAAFLLLPIAFALAILRYRLYDIDVVIRKTVVYSVVTGLLALIYFSSVVLLQRFFTTRTGQESPVAIVVSTLLIAALFTPLRRRVQTIIDQRFFRRRYDAQQVLASFGAAVRNETDPDQLTAELLRVVKETVQPEHVSLWLRLPGLGHRQAEKEA